MAVPYPGLQPPSQQVGFGQGAYGAVSPIGHAVPRPFFHQHLRTMASSLRAVRQGMASVADAPNSRGGLAGLRRLLGRGPRQTWLYLHGAGRNQCSPCVAQFLVANIDVNDPAQGQQGYDYSL